MVQYYDTPISTDKQNVTAPQIRANFSQINTTFGVDHYDFTTAIPNGGFHKAVTTPDQVTPPSTGAGIASFYGLKFTNPIGVIQYSRGPSSGVPSPVTYLQSPASGITLAQNTTTNVLDFTGITNASAMLYAYDSSTGNRIVTYINFHVNTFNNAAIVTSSGFSSTLIAVTSGNILQLRNSSSTSISFTNLVWTLQFLRIQ